MGDVGDSAGRADRWINRVAAHAPWIVPALVGLVIGGGAVYADRALIEAARRHVATVVDEAALAAVSDPVSGERLVAEALFAAELDERSRVAFERGRVDGGGFVALDGAGTSVRLRVTTYLTAPWRRFIGLAEPVYEAEAVATLAGSAMVEVGPPAAVPGSFGRMALAAFAGFDPGLDEAGWRALDRTPVPLDRFVAAVRGGAALVDGEGADADGGPMPMRLAVESLALAAQPEDGAARAAIGALVAAAATSSASLVLDSQIRLPEEGAGPTQSVAAVLLALLRAAAAEAPRTLRLDAPAEGILALDIALALTAGATVGRLLPVHEGERVVTPALVLSLVATVPATALPGATEARVPLEVRVEPAEILLGSVGCTGTGGASVSARPAAARVAFDGPKGEPSPLLEAPALAAWIAGRGGLEGGPPVDLAFPAAAIAEGRIESARTTLPFPAMLGGVFAAPAVTVRVDGDRIAPAAARDEAVRIVRDTTPFLSGVVVDLLAALGIAPGDASVRIHGLACADAMLADRSVP